MGVASSVLMATIDASDSSSVDEAECRLLVGDAFDAEMWRSAPKVDAGRVTKRTLLQHLGWPSEVFDGRSGTREEARAVNDAAETAARGTPHFYELSPDAARDISPAPPCSLSTTARASSSSRRTPTMTPLTLVPLRRSALAAPAPVANRTCTQLGPDSFSLAPPEAFAGAELAKESCVTTSPSL